MSNLLALDLGTKTGVAYKEGGKAYAYSKEWATRDEVSQWRKDRSARRGDPRILRFYDWLKSQVSGYGRDIIVFEDVEFCSQTYQCQLWTSFRTCVWVVAHIFPYVKVEVVPVASLKLWATGNGGASKKGMMNALVKQGSSRFSLVDMKRKTDRWRVKDALSSNLLDDNAVDALWLYSWGLENLT